MKLLYSKFMIFIIAVLLLGSIIMISGCQPSSPEDVNSDQSTTIVTSFYPMYIMTINICQDIPNIKVVNMTQPYTGCLHDYQLSTSDVKTLEQARIFVINGAGMESFMEKVASQQPNLKIVTASQGIPLIQGSGELGENPHVWVSIAYAIQEVKNIGEQLAALDSVHAEQYRNNTAAYVTKLETLRTKMHQQLDGKQNTNIVTFHEAFPYFAQEFNLNIVAVVEREPGSEPSAAELADTINLIKSANVSALFAEPQYPAKTADAIALETGVKVYSLDPAVTGPNDLNAYINIMETNLKTLEVALK